MALISSSSVQFATRHKVHILIIVAIGYLLLSLHKINMGSSCKQKKKSEQIKDGYSEYRLDLHVTDTDFHEDKDLVQTKEGNTFIDPHPLPKVIPKVGDKVSEEIKQLLLPGLVPNTVHYVWCGDRWFEFKHFMSVKSVIRALKPDMILLHYDIIPKIDKKYYHRWLSELKHDNAFFTMKLIDRFEPFGSKACATPQGRIDYVLHLMRDSGGLYIHENTWLVDFPIWMRKQDVVYGLTENREGFLLARGYAIKGIPLEQVLTENRHKVVQLGCGTPAELVSKHKVRICILVDGVLYPKDIWRLENVFGRLSRLIFYGKEDIPVPKPSYDAMIPNIAHMVWIGGGAMDFLFYLSCLSLLFVANVENLYIHGNIPPTGEFWEEIKSNPRVRYIVRETPEYVYGTRVNVLSHVTDVYRVDIMIKYGGIYVDTDTVFVRPLDYEIRGYDAIATYDFPEWDLPFPDIINFGVSAGKRGAPFWKLFQQSMKHFLDNDWAYNGLRQPYKVQERYPEMIWVNPHFSVICFELKCHPTWVPNYHNESIHHENSNSIVDWRKDVYAFHWTYPTPPELKSYDNLMKSNTMFSEIGKYILEKAGRLKQ